MKYIVRGEQEHQWLGGLADKPTAITPEETPPTEGEAGWGGGGEDIFCGFTVDLCFLTQSLL